MFLAVLATAALNVQAGVVFTNLHNFGVFTSGASPSAGLVQGADGNFYGTTSGGGMNDFGTVFKINASGSLTSLYSFTGGNDGANPYAGLVQSADGNFYGTTAYGGTNNGGTIFKINATGSFTSLYSFTGGNDGGEPFAALALGADGNFYGTARFGGTNGGYGTIFKINASGMFTSLHSFNAEVWNPSALVQGADGNFYGTTSGDGGTTYPGTIFKINASGSFTTLYSFTGGNDGRIPGALVQGADGNFYGMTDEGGTNGSGTIFKINASGSFASLYSFPGSFWNPGALVQGADGNFYGTTGNGGTSYSGTIFKINASGTFTTLYSFTGGNDGSDPFAALVQSAAGDFYGTAYFGGTAGAGTIFKIDGSGSFTSLYSFAPSNDGAAPWAALVLGSDGNYYGTASSGGGATPCGTIFKINASGTFTSLYSFTGSNDGANPFAALAQSADGNFYGTTAGNGANNEGTIFKINATGSFTSLYSFTGSNDGANPYAALVQSADGNFYGTASHGGTNGFGTIFKINATGSFISLYSFTGSNDGSYPYAALAQGAGGNFYGTTLRGGTNDCGTIFKINASGSFTSLYSCTGSNGGSYPYAALVQGADGNFYGTTLRGGANDAGTVFKIDANGSFTTLYSFTFGNDGAFPYAALALASDGNFYGATSFAGPNDGGTIFKINASGSFATLYSFAGGDLLGHGVYEAFGVDPVAGLIQASDGNFYGTTSDKGSEGRGSVFRISGATGPIPTLSFTASPTNGTEPLSVQFTSPAADSNGSNIINWNWNFGDGATSLLQNPSHIYATPGAFSPTLMADNSAGVTVYASGSGVLVTGTNGGGLNPTLPFAASPTNGTEPLSVQFTSPAVDSNGSNIVNWNWNFGDGATSILQNPSHIYATPGAFSPALVATNGAGLTVYGSGPGVLVAGTNPGSSYVFGPEVQASPPGNISYDPVQNVFQYTNLPDTGTALAYLPLSGTQATWISTSSDWTASLDATLAATLLPVSNGGKDPYVNIFLGLIALDSNSNSIHFLNTLVGMNNTDGGDSSDFPPGFYGTAVRVPGGPYSPTPLGNAFAYATNLQAGGSCVILPLAAGTNASPMDVPIGATSGVLTLTCDSSSGSVTAYYNHRPVARQSIAGWKQLQLIIGGGSKAMEVANGAITASGFYVTSLPAIATIGGDFGVRSNQFGFDIKAGASSVVIVEAATNLSAPVWTPVATNTPGSGAFYFADPKWTNYSVRYYRARFQ